MQELAREIGAVASWAAAVGLVALSALHLSHARDLKRLREWARRAGGRPEASAQTVSAASPRAQPWHRRPGAPYLAAVLAGLLVLAGAAAYGIPRLTGDDVAPRKAEARDKPKRKPAPVKPGDVTVAVLNGTTVPGLAAGLSGRLATAGFVPGAIDVFPDQQLAESVVQYAPGHEAEAKAVGRKVGINRREPVTADGRAIAPDATVIVIAGADKAP